MKFFARLTRPFWSNPVVVRDLRVRMRGAKTYWGQAVYLFVLGLIALAGYSSAIGYENSGGGFSAVDAQSRLQGFYYYIFMTLAGCITLIAPALTATAITSERQRLTMELLITTPLSFSELLIGKLVSSVAFLALLLCLSLPASALCILLGGATLGEVFRVYLLLAIDGLLLAAIGVYFSCALRKSIGAMGWTYFAVIIALFATASSVGATVIAGVNQPILFIGAANPFIAAYYGGGFVELGGWHIPVWVGTATVSALAIRLLLTAASVRLGNFGGNPVGSLRRQILFLCGLAVFLIFVQAGVSSSGIFTGRGIATMKFADGLKVTLALFFMGAIPFLPALFTPVFDDENPEAQTCGSYNLKAAFRPDPAGALPFFQIWTALLVGCIAGTFWFAKGALSRGDLALSAEYLYYFSGLGFLFWAISRRAAVWVQSVSGARALAFCLYALLTLIPFLMISLAGSGSQDTLLTLSIFYPFSVSEPEKMTRAALGMGTALYLIGTLIYPFWRPVKRKAAAAAPTRRNPKASAA